MPFMPFAPAGTPLPSMAPPFQPFGVTAAPVLQRLFPSTNGPGASTAASGGWLLGCIFSVTGGMRWLNSYFFWVPPGGDVVARKFALWNQFSTTQNQLIAAANVTSGTLVAGQWNQVNLPSPVQLAPGALYLACTGWTAVNGIPLTGAQFGTGDPLAAGITQGFLSGWSATSGSNTFPAATVNYGLGQMLFSNALGNDPTVNPPNNGSGDDNFWVDILVSDTAPNGYAGSYRFWPNMGDLGNFSLDTANGFTLGWQVNTSRTVTSNRIWFYSPATVTQLPTAVGVFRISDQSLQLSNLAPTWSGLAGSGWISTTLSGSLPAGSYKAAVFQGANVVWNAAVANYTSTGFGGGGLVAGPMTAPNNATAAAPGQASYNTSTGGIAYPNTNIGPFHYGVDWEVT